MKSAILLISVALSAAAPQGKLSFRNLFKDPVQIRTNPSPHIIGGQDAEPHSIPFQVFLEMYTETSGGYCGGSLISQNYVLTAGHCGDGVRRAVVTIGGHLLSQESEGEITIESNNVIVHPDYNRTLIINDIALIALPEPVTLTSTISTVNLPSLSDVGNTYIGETARISGWGLTNGFNHVMSDTLQYVDVRVISNKECEQDFETVISTIVCTSGNEKTGSCSGDSGGPLIVNQIQIGLVSFGVSDCLPGYASAFTRITSFLDWIAANSDVIIE